ncbi:MAG: 16S rRNA (cytidine(1402)-2'-O)-methyltransferase [Spirochaetes bacterium]|nr:16S rRNA (cytidine(1402)-2'-O)-methyltransferase [Spirochaetota bacterium]
MGTLYIIATPLGNLQDITYRAIETLRQVDVVACEDTRRSIKLLNAYNIQKPLLSCHGHNETKSALRVRELLSEGKKVAYLSDAGTPGLSDPGAKLVRVAREAGFSVLPIPGPSAFATLVSVAGLKEASVHFEGFLGIKPGKRRLRLRELLERNEPFVLYESVHRIEKLLQELRDLAPERTLFIGREMTKAYEEYLEGSVEELLAQVQEHPDRKKGEYAVLVYSGKKS